MKSSKIIRNAKRLIRNGVDGYGTASQHTRRDAGFAAEHGLSPSSSINPKQNAKHSPKMPR
jgi:hypothetical protein